MNRILSITFNFAGPGMPMFVPAGGVRHYTLPAGCVLRESADMQSWSVVSTPSPFVAATDTNLRIDCDVFTAPVTATLSIS